MTDIIEKAQELAALATIGLIIFSAWAVREVRND